MMSRAHRAAGRVALASRPLLAALPRANPAGAARSLAPTRAAVAPRARPMRRPVEPEVATGCWPRSLSGSAGISTDRVGVEVSDHVATVTLQDQKTRNCLSTTMMTDLHDALVKLEADPHVKVVVLAHTGKVFSSGHNLKELQLAQETTGDTKAIFETCNKLMLKVRSSRLPVIASISGFATAAGCQLAATADMCIAGEGATFSTPGVSIGLFCHTPGVALGRAVGYKAAMHMLLTGDIITAEQGVRCGLVNEVVPADALAEHTRSVALKIAKAPSAVIGLGKRTFYEQMAHGDVAEAYRYAGGVMQDNMSYPDAREGIGAFIDKRPPQWTDAGL